MPINTNALIARLEREQYAIEPRCSQPEYRRGHNAAMRHVIAILRVEGGLVELVRNSAKWPDECDWGIDRLFDMGGES